MISRYDYLPKRVIQIVSGSRSGSSLLKSILAGSPAPPSHKKLFVIPGGGHNWLWMWKGDANVPSHDQIIREFLRECGK